jgi:hypothetical protein
VSDDAAPLKIETFEEAQSALDSSAVLGMQAADFLAVGSHVQKVCKALAAKLFAAAPNQDSRGIRVVAEQVLLNVPVVALCEGYLLNSHYFSFHRPVGCLVTAHLALLVAHQC